MTECESVIASVNISVYKDPFQFPFSSLSLKEKKKRVNTQIINDVDVSSHKATNILLCLNSLLIVCNFVEKRPSPILDMDFTA